jgi:hypothetical protein
VVERVTRMLDTETDILGKFVRGDPQRVRHGDPGVPLLSGGAGLDAL